VFYKVYVIPIRIADPEFWQARCESVLSDKGGIIHAQRSSVFLKSNTDPGNLAGSTTA
jgi:hypothetical protein